MATDNKIISKSETFAFLGGSHVLSVLRGFPKVPLMHFLISNIGSSSVPDRLIRVKCVVLMISNPNISLGLGLLFLISCLPAME